MKIRRREFGLWAASAIGLAVIPRVAFADSGDTSSPSGGKDDDGKHRGTDTKSSVHNEGATTAQSISHNWTFNFSSDEIAEDHWAEHWPQGGTAQFLIDYKGNWLMSASFPPQPKLKYDNESTVGVGIKAAALDNQIVAFVHRLKVTKDGGSFQHQGHDPIIADLWKSVVKGHKWHSSEHSFELKPKKPKPDEAMHAGGSNGGSNGGGGGSSLGDVVQDGVDGVKDVVGDIGNALGGAVSDVISWL